MKRMTRSALLAELTRRFQDLPLFAAECAVSRNIDKRVLGEMVNHGSFTVKDLTSQLALVHKVEVIEDCPKATSEMTRENVRLLCNLYDYCALDAMPRTAG